MGVALRITVRFRCCHFGCYGHYGLSAVSIEGCSEPRWRSHCGNVSDARDGCGRCCRVDRFIAEWKIIGGGSAKTAVPNENPDLNPDLKQKLGQDLFGLISQHLDPGREIWRARNDSNVRPSDS